LKAPFLQGLLENSSLWEAHRKVLEKVEPVYCEFGSSRFFVSWGHLLFKVFPRKGIWANRECFYLNAIQAIEAELSPILALKSTKPIELDDYKIIVLKDLRTCGGGMSLWQSMKHPVDELKYISNQLENLWQLESFDQSPNLLDYKACYEFIKQEVNQKTAGLLSVYLDNTVIPKHTASHSDLHLGQFLSIDSSLSKYVLHDFEGVPFSNLGEKFYSKLWGNRIGDIASLLRSVDYWYRTQKKGSQGLTSEIRLSILKSLAINDKDYQCISYAYLLRNLYEISYEEKYRPDWVGIPKAGLVDSIKWVNSFSVKKSF
jgi:hypothetical protein